MTVTEAVERGIGRLKRPIWAACHIELYLTRGGVHPGQYGEAPPGEGLIFYGPWMRMYDPPVFLAQGLPWNHFEIWPTFGGDLHLVTDFEEWVETPEYVARYSGQTPNPDRVELPL